MSSGGRLILMNTYLSNTPTYIMGFYRLIDGQHRELDHIRKIFFWQQGGTHKYHMAKWESIATPKDFEGMGTLNTRLMNDCVGVLDPRYRGPPVMAQQPGHDRLLRQPNN
jgi:hypothetical protein